MARILTTGDLIGKLLAYFRQLAGMGLLGIPAESVNWYKHDSDFVNRAGNFKGKSGGSIAILDGGINEFPSINRRFRTWAYKIVIGTAFESKSVEKLSDIYRLHSLLYKALWANVHLRTLPEGQTPEQAAAYLDLVDDDDTFAHRLLINTTESGSFAAPVESLQTIRHNIFVTYEYEIPLSSKAMNTRLEGTPWANQ